MDELAITIAAALKILNPAARQVVADKPGDPQRREIPAHPDVAERSPKTEGRA